MKKFRIENTETNLTWVITNLDERDYKVDDTIEVNEIEISYFNEMQKNVIINAIHNN